MSGALIDSSCPGLTPQVGFTRFAALLKLQNSGKPSSAGIHQKESALIEDDGLPGHQRVYARLRRAMPGNDD
jgi:hypothetical protein